MGTGHTIGVVGEDVKWDDWAQIIIAKPRSLGFILFSWGKAIQMFSSGGTA